MQPADAAKAPIIREKRRCSVLKADGELEGIGGTEPVGGPELGSSPGRASIDVTDDQMWKRRQEHVVLICHVRPIEPERFHGDLHQGEDRRDALERTGG